MFRVHGRGRASARSGQRRVRSSTATAQKTSGGAIVYQCSGAARSELRYTLASSGQRASAQRADAVAVGGRPFPDIAIAEQVVFKIEKLTERVRRPKASAALPQPEICHLATPCRRRLYGSFLGAPAIRERQSTAAGAVVLSCTSN